LAINGGFSWLLAAVVVFYGEFPVDLWHLMVFFCSLTTFVVYSASCGRFRRVVEKTIPVWF
jgi:hypothetical protein